MRRRQLRPRDYGRCTRCGRLTELASLTTYNGGKYGPNCLKLAIQDALREQPRT